MFGFKKKSEVITVQTKQTPEEIMGLKEYISVDSIKAHLVDILEENKRLKAKTEENDSYQQRLTQDYRKKYELSQITADEYKKRLEEEQEKTRKQGRELETKQREYEDLKRKYNDLVCENEMKKKTTVNTAAADIPEAKTKRGSAKGENA